jgi:hypothetical protein
MTLEWKKSEWTKYSDAGYEYSEYMLVRESKCGNFRIYRWDSKNTYNVMKLEECTEGLYGEPMSVFYFDAVNDPSYPIENLKSAKEFCEKLNKGITK